MHVAAHHTLEELQRLARSQTKVRARLRIQAVLLAKRGHTAISISESLETPVRTIESWIHRYNKEDLGDFHDQPRSGRKCRLDASQKKALKARIDAGAQPEDGICSLRGIDLQWILEKEFGVCYSLNGVYYLLHQLGYSSLVPRPEHRQADPVAQEAFKKNCGSSSGKSNVRTKS